MMNYFKIFITKHAWLYIPSIALFLFITPALNAQHIQEIMEDYEDYKGAYHVRVFVNFVERTNDQWITALSAAQLQTRAEKLLNNLNNAYNEHQIYFVPVTGGSTPVTSCVEDDDWYDTSVDDNLVASDLHDKALDIWDFGDIGIIQGEGEGGIPGPFLWVQGSAEDPNDNDDEKPASHSPTLIHEVGHCLGLRHTYAGEGDYDGCSGLTGCPPEYESYTPLCECCEDLVCDTDPTDVGIVLSEDCSEADVPIGNNYDEKDFLNYMAGRAQDENEFCHNQFTPGQVQRMRVYLERSNIIDVIQIKPQTLSGVLSGGIYGNIIVEAGTELEITSQIEMLPDASIYIEKGYIDPDPTKSKNGGLLRVRSTITGACGQMWRGVIVEGDDSPTTQSHAFHGKVVVHSTGKIEHAKVGIEVQDIDASNMPLSSSSGGIVEILGGTIENNIIGVRFGPWKVAPNISKFYSPKFKITNAYRGGSVQPVLLDITSIMFENFIGGEFFDLRSACSSPSDRAIGAILKGSGGVFEGCEFKNLDIGIWADEVNLLFGSIRVYSNDFNNCYTGLIAHGKASFLITGNNFIVKKPDACPANQNQRIIGAILEGNTTGFIFKGNDFSHGNTTAPSETLVGTIARGLGEGLNNEIRENTYTDLYKGNLAQGFNGFKDAGLIYLCNTNLSDEFTYGEPWGKDFEVQSSGSVRKIQGIVINANLTESTGNVFSEDAHTFYNADQNDIIDYYYYNGATEEDPSEGANSNNITHQVVFTPNSNCSPNPVPCTPPCDEGSVADWDDGFNDNENEWIRLKGNLPSLIDTSEIAATKDSILFHRLEMDKYASRLLQQYTLDTTDVETDSIIVWLQRSQSFSSDLRLVRHYFFNMDTTLFDTLWTNLTNGYDLDSVQIDIYNDLDDIYDLIRADVFSNRSVFGLPNNIIDSLRHWSEWCSEPGFLSQSILIRNGIFVRSDCSGGTQGRQGSEGPKDIPDIEPSLIHLFPNPADGSITLRADSKVQFDRNVMFYNMNGQKVLNSLLPGNILEASINTSSLAPGIYFVKIEGKNATVQKAKVVINR